jgi:hypothetical protein
MTDRRGALGWLEKRAPTLFLVAGGLAVVFAANTALRTFVGTSYPVVQDVVGPIGFFVGVVGLFGLYPALADRTPTLARIAAAVAVVPAVGYFAIVVMGIGSTAGVLSYPTGPLAAIPIVVIVTMVLAFGLFGVTSLRAGVRSRVVGALLLVESAMFLLLILNVVPFVLTDIGHVIAYLGVGVTLWTEGVPTGSAEPMTDADAAP